MALQEQEGKEKNHNYTWEIEKIEVESDYKQANISFENN